MINFFEIIGMGFIAGFAFMGGLILFCWIGDVICQWWNDKR